GLVNALEEFAGDYAVHALLLAPVPPPGGLAAAWLQSWLWIPGLALLFVFVPLLFPTGRPLSPRWGRVAWLAVAVVAAHSLVVALSPEPLTNHFIGLAEIANPLGVDSPIFFEIAPGGLFLDIALSLLLVGLVPVAIASSLLRLRRATADERQQMKWFVSAAAALAALFVLQAVARPVLGGASPAFTVVASALLTAA